MQSHHRPIRSFVRRQGRMTSAQRDAYHKLWQFYGLDKLVMPKSPLIIEIGFGMGDSLAQMAKQNPQFDYIGIDVHRPGIGALLHQIDTLELKNLKVMEGDATVILKEQVANNSLHGLQIFFPDPWPKKRHYKRRIIQQSFLDLAAQKLQPGGFIHCATDWQPYAQAMLALLQAHPAFKNIAKDYMTEPKRPITKFEKRAHKEGRGVWDLIGVKLALY